MSARKALRERTLQSSGFLVLGQWEIYQPLRSQLHVLQQPAGPTAFAPSLDLRGSEGTAVHVQTSAATPEGHLQGCLALRGIVLPTNLPVRVGLRLCFSIAQTFWEQHEPQVPYPQPRRRHHRVSALSGRLPSSRWLPAKGDL